VNNVESVARHFPLINEIQNPSTREKVAAVWMEMLKRSTWKSIDEAKFKEGMEISLVSHVNAATESALAVSRILAKNHGVTFDEDLIITFGLLHDVDKVIAYERGPNGEVVVSKSGRLIQHGVMSAILAHNAGFSEDMLHLILTHTPTQNMKPVFREGILFGYIDLCAWEIAAKFANREG